MTKLESPEHKELPSHGGSDFSLAAFDVLLHKLDALRRSSTLIDLVGRGVSFFGIQFLLIWPTTLDNYFSILPMGVLCFFWYMQKRAYIIQIVTLEKEIISLVLSQERQRQQPHLSWGDVFVNSENRLELAQSRISIIAADKIEPVIWFFVSYLIFLFHVIY